MKLQYTIEQLREITKGLKPTWIVEFTDRGPIYIPPPQRESKPRKRKIDHARVRELYEKGFGLSQIAKKLGTTRQTVNYILLKDSK